LNYQNKMYPLIKIPAFASKDFFSFSKEEAKEYFKWVLQIKNERIKILEQYVHKAYPEWKLDFTRESFEQLYKWFSNQVAYRDMNEDEKEAVKKQISMTPLLVDVIPIPELTFTDETVSICFDIGLYLGDSLICQNKEIKWTTKLNSTNYIYYGQPLIAKAKSKVPLNPRASMEGIARRILDKDCKEITFVQLFSINTARL